MRPLPARVALSALAAMLLLSGCGLAEARESALKNARVKPLDMADSLRPGLVGMPDYPATGWEPGEATATPLLPGSKNPLARIGLRAGDLSDGNRVAVIPDGTSLGIPTLDFCEADYPSEALRVKRLQTGAYDADGVFTGLSTEVVRYETPDAALQALSEVVAARRACPVGKEITTFDGHTLEFTFHGAPGPSATPLVDAEHRLIVHTTMVVDGAPQSAFLVYQVQGSLLAALYATDASGEPFTQASLDSLYGLAGDIADRLRAANSAGTTA